MKSMRWYAQSVCKAFLSVGPHRCTQAECVRVTWVEEGGDPGVELGSYCIAGIELKRFRPSCVLRACHFVEEGGDPGVVLGSCVIALLGLSYRGFDRIGSDQWTGKSGLHGELCEWRWWRTR